ncbi:MAG TPA: rod shape-determining protein MreC [Candidatus Binatia bacterium]|nr:rod shape-determining protein MreC [Candidatus Binatia bacterium]
MKQRVGSVSIAVAARHWTQRFAFVLLVTFAFGVMLVGKADTVVISRARTLLIDLIAPVMDAASRPIASARDAADQVQELISLKEENARLAHENQTLLEWQTVGRELQSQNASLRDLLRFTPDPRATYVTAPVIADTSSSYVRSLIVLAGESDGVVKGQAAITGVGLVGRVLEVGKRASRVLLLTDISARVPVIIERTRDQAVLAGNNSDNPELRYLPRDVDIKAGDRIVTSGIGGNFPAGLPVGEVVGVTNGRILVQLYAQLDRMEYLRLVNYSLPGILMEDLGVDTSKSGSTPSPVAGRLPGAE